MYLKDATDYPEGIPKKLKSADTHAQCLIVAVGWQPVPGMPFQGFFTSIPGTWWRKSLGSALDEICSSGSGTYLSNDRLSEAKQRLLTFEAMSVHIEAMLTRRE